MGINLCNYLLSSKINMLITIDHLTIKCINSKPLIHVSCSLTPLHNQIVIRNKLTIDIRKEILYIWPMRVSCTKYSLLTLELKKGSKSKIKHEIEEHLGPKTELHCYLVSPQKNYVHLCNELIPFCMALRIQCICSTNYTATK